METKVVSMDRMTFDQWQSIGLMEGLNSDQEVAKFLIHMYDVNKEQSSPSLVCFHCQAPISRVCRACRSTALPDSPSPTHTDLTCPQRKHPHPASSLQDSTNSQPPEQNGLSPPGSNHLLLQSSQSQSRTNPLPKINLSHSQSSQLCFESSQSQTGNHLKPGGDSQSQASTNQPQPAPDQSQAVSGQCPSGGSQSELLTTGRVAFNTEASLSSTNPSQRSQPVVRDSFAVPVKDEDVNDDEDTTSVAPDPPASGPESPVLKQESSAVQADSSSAHEASQTTDPSPPQRGRKRWGATESKALAWFLDRYDLHTPSTWNDCALLLNAALHTSASGDEWRKLAMKKNLLSPRTTNHTQSSTSSTTFYDPESRVPRKTRCTVSTPCETEPEAPRRTRSTVSTPCEMEPEATRRARSTSASCETEPEAPRRTRSTLSTLSETEPEAPRRTRSTVSAPCETEPEAVRRTRSIVSTPCSTEPEAPRRTRSCGKRTEGLSMSETGPQNSRRTRSNSRKAAKPTETRNSQRPLRSSLPPQMQVVPDTDDEEDMTFAQTTMSMDSGEESKENVQNVLMLSEQLLTKQAPKDNALQSNTRTDGAQQVAPASAGDESERLTLSQNDGKVIDTADPSRTSQNVASSSNTKCSPLAGNRLSWYYLGVADVDLPDVTQKRKSFKRSPNDRYQCKECSSSFTHRGILVKHIRLAHLKWRPYRCHVCSAAYATKTKLQRHVNVAHTKVRPFCCETCGASFVDHYTLLGHKETHNEDRQYRFFCELCGKGYYGMRELKRHMETHSSRPTKSLLCWVCGKAMRTTQYLRIHLRTHSPEKAFTCRDCGHVFTSKCALQKHQTSLACRKRIDKNRSQPEGREEEVKKKRVVSVIRKRQERKSGNFQCDVCHKYFSAKKNIYKHKRSVHGIEAKREIDNRIIVTDPAEIARYLTPKNRDTSSLKFPCDICSKRFSSQESMRKHKNIIHFGRRDYKCDLCEKTFTRHTSVIEHKHNVHNPDGKSARQTAQCDICQKTFAAKNSLRKHLKTVHFGLLPYSCSMCSKKFASRYHLREHHKSSGHSEAPQEEEKGMESTSTDVDSFQRTMSPPTSANHMTDACGRTTTVTNQLPSRLSTLHPVAPWTHLSPVSGALTSVQRIPVTSLQQGELSANSSTPLRGSQSVHLWDMG